MPKYTADKLIAAMRQYNGNISAVARAFKTNRQKIYDFMEQHPTVKRAREEARESMLDNAESALYRQALNGDTTALIFLLKTQGYQRGYQERQHVTMDVNIRQEAERLAQEYGLDPDEVLAEAERIVKAR